MNKAILDLMQEIEAGRVEPSAANLRRLEPYLPF